MQTLQSHRLESAHPPASVALQSCPSKADLDFLGSEREAQSLLTYQLWGPWGPALLHLYYLRLKDVEMQQRHRGKQAPMVRILNGQAVNPRVF
jgi:hypothetical protein